MEYVYAALLLNSTGMQVTEDGVKKILTAAGAKPDEARIKSLVAALQGVDIKDAISKAAPMAAAPVSSAAPEAKKEEKKEEKKEGPSEEEAAAGLGALFG